MKCIPTRETSPQSLSRVPAVLWHDPPSSARHEQSRSRHSSQAGALPLTVRERVLLHVALHVASISIAFLERLPAGRTAFGPQPRLIRPDRRSA